MLWSNRAHAPQLLSLRSGAREPQLLNPRISTMEARALQSLCSTREVTARRRPHTATGQQLPLAATGEKPAQQ